MHKCKIHILPDDIHVEVDKGTLISNALKSVGINLTLPCGGRGACGHCIVFSDGVPLKSCITEILEDMVIHVPHKIRLSGQQVLTDIRLYEPENNKLPLVEQIWLQLTTPTLDDSISDSSRLKKALSEKTGFDESLIWIEPSCLIDLPYKLRENDFSICVSVFYENNGITVLSTTDKPIYGIAIDIGTTTVATALCDLKTGLVVDTTGIANPQANYGSDVISRIVYTEENQNGTTKLQNCILDGISDSIETLTSRTGISKDNILSVVVAANTVMSHFLLNLPTDYLRREPYVPAVSEYPLIRPADLRLPVLSSGRVLVIPSVSSYVGGDIVAGVIATELYNKEGLHLFVDVGTNGEMVLAGEGFMMACSCSAGPAFEGAGISCGSRAIQGAIDNVYYKNGQMYYDVIGGDNVTPVSICGSGLISLLSALLEAGIIDRSGRFTTSDEFYTLVSGVTITEADIQNLIRAKGAIFAGMRVLLKHLELEPCDLEHILIAGGFGRNLNINGAMSIGMFPYKDKDSSSYVGNSSLAGALKVLNDRTININEIAASILNMELSIGNSFMEEFTQACFLPHTDLNLFKNF